MHRNRFVPPGVLAAMLAALVSPPGLVFASGDEQGPAPALSQVRPEPDFWFKRPRGVLGVRSGWILTRGGSDLFDFVQRHLTIDEGDFNAPALAADLGFTVGPRMDVLGGFEYNKAATDSHYRDFVDNTLQEIEQRTSLEQVTVSGSVKFALRPRGREISRLAFIPSGVIPFVGAGAGATHYKFQQVGSFVDFVDQSVFDEVFTASGWTPSAHVFGGVDLQAYKRLYVTLEGRYTWAAGDLGSDFIGFDPIDLAGFRMLGGINVVF